MQAKGTQFTAVFHPANPRAMGGIPTHTVEAWSPEHADTAWAQAHPSERSSYEGSSVDPGIRPIGSMSWHHKTGEIRGVYTTPEHQRQGVASSLYQKGQEIAAETRGVPKPKHSAQRTDSGEAWSKAVGGRRPARSTV
jgi:GNAT superfamily N-acetyltransferase